MAQDVLLCRLLQRFVAYQLNMASSPNPDSTRRPTMRTIADAAGVTHATVSMALRNHPTISAPTRRKVQRIARQMGYRPDPQVSKLMHHLRMKHKPQFQSTIAALTTLREADEPPYARALREGARRAAEAFGYGFSTFHLEYQEKRDASLQRILRSRGVEGLLLLPLATPTNLSRWLDWRQFAVVAATYGVLAPDIHRVVPDQFGNTMLICERLARLGCRRLGLVMWEGTEITVGHRFSAPVMWQNTMGGTEFVPAFTYASDKLSGLREWFETERPDALIVGEETIARRIMKELRLHASKKVRVALTERSAVSPFPGIDQRAAAVGAAAAAQLHALIQRGEKGAPDVPSVMMIKGHWIGENR